MEGWEDEPDITEMTVTFFQMETAGLAGGSFVRNTHTLVERAICSDRPAMFEVEKLSVRDFYYRLTDNIIIRPD